MPKEYVGHLPLHDPLHPYLQRDNSFADRCRRHRADFRVYRMKGSKVYLYEETHSRAQVVGKFATSQRTRQESTTCTWCAIRSGRLPASRGAATRRQ